MAPGWRQLPSHRIPMRLRDKGAPDARGKNEDACWKMGQGPFQSGRLGEKLVLDVDGMDHGTVQPAQKMVQIEFEQALAATRNDWQKDEN